MNVNFREFPVLRRRNRVRGWAMVNPYCGACARNPHVSMAKWFFDENSPMRGK
jgi:hypothetical protein